VLSDPTCISVRGASHSLHFMYTGTGQGFGYKRVQIILQQSLYNNGEVRPRLYYKGTTICLFVITVGDALVGVGGSPLTRAKGSGSESEQV